MATKTGVAPELCPSCFWPVAQHGELTCAELAGIAARVAFYARLEKLPPWRQFFVRRRPYEPPRCWARRPIAMIDMPSRVPSPDQRVGEVAA